MCVYLYIFCSVPFAHKCNRICSAGLISLRYIFVTTSREAGVKDAATQKIQQKCTKSNKRQRSTPRYRMENLQNKTKKQVHLYGGNKLTKINPTTQITGKQYIKPISTPHE